jgi:hypothetical protein
MENYGEKKIFIFINMSNNVKIVVARYNESLNWLKEFPFNNFEYIVYNKGDDENFIKDNVIKIINIPNVGRCDHTYLYYIIENYDELSNITVFLPGSLNIPYKKEKATKILNYIINYGYKNAYFIGSYVESLQYHFKDFKLDSWKCSSEENYSKNSESELIKCKIRPYYNWYKYFFNNTESHWFTYGGVFSIDKRDILQHPIYRYIHLLYTVNQYSNPEASHYIERSWAAIFFPFLYTIKINE